ncbi:hypothetical protein [Mesorhizobium salmacidum]|uniref:TIR domain-containing protein n=1 Tax=Mesorhizobium salmacidum TaxID=3015171 RepID=A0ABU8KQL1_9HYPH
MARDIRTCYISAPEGAQIQVIRRELSRRHIAISSISIESTDLATQVRSAVSNVDLVIGVLTTARKSSWVLFELGIAWAERKPVLLIAPPKIDFIPSSLQRFVVLRANPRNSEAIGFALDQLLAASLEEKPSPPPRRDMTQLQGSDAYLAIQAVDAALHSMSGQVFEELVATTLRKAGVELLSEFATGASRRADLAIWSDALQPIMGNPILVETKLNLRSSTDLKLAAHALAEQVGMSGTRWGLLLFGNGPSQATIASTKLPSNVIVIDVKALFGSLRHSSFAEIVKDLRNQKVHGIAP